MSIRLRFLIRVFSICFIATGMMVSPKASSAAEERHVFAVASCTQGEGSEPIVNVTIANNSKLRIYVAYYGSYSTPQAISTAGLQGLLLEETPSQDIVPVEDGETVVLDAPWIGRESREDEVTGTLVVTSAGLLMPSCGFGEARIDNPNPQPVVAGEEGFESATAMALAIGQLEAYKAYPALYALLHEDSRELVTFDAFACAYAETYGPPAGEDTLTIYSTEVDDITWVNWTWDVNGVEYESTAEVTYTQDTGIFPKNGDLVQATEHLVRVDGIWRTFFGTDAESLEALSGDCDLPEYI